MLARRWRLRRRASQRGIEARRGGINGSTGPCCEEGQLVVDIEGSELNGVHGFVSPIRCQV